MAKSIRFFNDDVTYTLRDKTKIRSWILQSCDSENHSVLDLNIILCSDNQLLTINKSHLQHDFYTDIITFDYSEGNNIKGEIYISLDRVKDNSKTLETLFIDELHRVIIHGVLHLCGYGDKSKNEKKQMRLLEDKYLDKRFF